MPHRVVKPARFERVRCDTARLIFRVSPVLAIKLVPRHHPWRVLAESARNDLIDLASATLRPRNSRGVVQVVEGVTRPPRDSNRTLLTLATGAGSAYFLLEAMSRYVPGPIGDATGLDEQVRLFERLGNLLS